MSEAASFCSLAAETAAPLGLSASVQRNPATVLTRSPFGSFFLFQRPICCELIPTKNIN